MKRIDLVSTFAVLILTSCCRQEGYIDSWYGPAHMAIDDYSWYYYELPKSLQDLSLFIDFRINTSSNPSTLYFGDAKILLKDLKTGKAELLYWEDSCYFESHHKGLIEKDVFYSPDYQIKHLEKYQNEGRDIYFPVAFFNIEGKRINHDDEGILLDTIRKCQSIFTPSSFLNNDYAITRILLEYDGDTLKPISTELTSGIKTDLYTMLNDVGVEWLDYYGSLKEVLSTYQTTHPEVFRVVFPSIIVFRYK